MPYWICPWLRDLVADSRRSNKETYLFHRLIFHRTSISIKFGRGLRDFKNRNPELLTSLFTVQRIFELNWLGLRWYFSNLLGCILINSGPKMIPSVHKRGVYKGHVSCSLREPGRPQEVAAHTSLRDATTSSHHWELAQECASQSSDKCHPPILQMMKQRLWEGRGLGQLSPKGIRLEPDHNPSFSGSKFCDAAFLLKPGRSQQSKKFEKHSIVPSLKTIP